MEECINEVLSALVYARECSYASKTREFDEEIERQLNRLRIERIAPRDAKQFKDDTQRRICFFLTNKL